MNSARESKMMKKFLILSAFILVFFYGCSEENNPVEVVETPPASSVWYDGNTYAPDSLLSWGMGKSQTDYIHNDKEYDWYIDQANTGSAAVSNCGPSCVTMAIKWYDKNFSKTAADARTMFPLNGGWWYTNNIIDYLNYYTIKNSIIGFSDPAQLETVLKDGNIAILCISTEFLRYNSVQTQRVDRFYSYASGHFIVIKGIRKVDNVTYFEAYDSNTWNAKYTDGSLKGKNRHYRSDDISNAIKKWWNYIIVVSKNDVSKNLNDRLEKSSAINHMWGK
ncbi:MAG: hypothetical protein EHM64_03790 [Ignavibacteriae bacterium]|nr:MAG: hypothetical protein EHM64_03790 [Ignavibacteriota bacterium]